MGEADGETDRQGSGSSEFGTVAVDNRVYCVGHESGQDDLDSDSLLNGFIGFAINKCLIYMI